MLFSVRYVWKETKICCFFVVMEPAKSARKDFKLVIFAGRRFGIRSQCLIRLGAVLKKSKLETNTCKLGMSVGKRSKEHVECHLLELFLYDCYKEEN